MIKSEKLKYISKLQKIIGYEQQEYKAMNNIQANQQTP